MVALDPSQRQTPASKLTSTHLTEGSEVEVSSNEEGFRGAWYRATVIESPPKTNLKRRKKALIEYELLLADDGSTPLTELVYPSHIRPLPPHEDACVFSENDVVEACYNDGWWVGVVRKVLESSRYMVYFDNPPDLIEFDAKDLRICLEWRNGAWVRPEKPQASESYFSSGSTVEVLLDEEKLRDIWFPALVVKECKDNTFLVKYSSSRNDDEVGEAKVIVDSRHIRPAPLQFFNRSFELLEKVDAVYNGGWRAGIITKVLSEGRYNVFFKQGNEDKELSQSELRLHVEWARDNSEVLIASDIKVQLGSNTPKKQGNDRQLERSATKTDNAGQLTPRTMTLRKSPRRPTPPKENPTLLALSPSNKRVKLIASNGSGVPSCLSKPLSEGNGVIQTLFVQSGLPRKTTEEISTTGDQSSVPTQSPLKSKRIKQEKSKTSQGKSQDKTGDTSVKCLYDLVKSKRSRGKSQAKTVEECNAEALAADGQTIEVDRTPVVEELPVVLGLKVSGVGNPQLAGPDNVAGDKSRKINQEKDGSTQRRKRGRPFKLPLTAEAGNKSGGVTNNIKTTDHSQVKVTADTRAGSSDYRATEVGTGVAKICNGTVDDDQPLSTWVGLQSSSNLEELRPLSAQTVTGTRDKHDQPLSTWVGLQSSSNLEELRPLSAQTVTGTRDKHPADVDATKNSVNDKIEKLPFLKKCPVWEATESLEAFKIIPQKPHFSPLAELNEEVREGTAIGMMIIFSNLFEKIPKLRMEDPKSVFDSTFVILLDLEKNGFDVTELKRRASELLAIKVAKEQLESELSDTGRMLIKRSGQKEKFEVEMTEIKKKITELQELQEAIQLKKDAEEVEVTRRKSEMDTVHECIQDARRAKGS